MSYFSSDVPARGELRVVPGSTMKRLTVSPGVHLHPLIGERLNINVVVLDARATAEVHTHEEEQMGVVIRGSCTFTDGTSTWELKTGDTYHAPPGAPHGATAGPEGCTVLDSFSPPRAGLAEMLET